jgi:hypothetical protein
MYVAMGGSMMVAIHNFMGETATSIMARPLRLSGTNAACEACLVR